MVKQPYGFIRISENVMCRMDFGSLFEFAYCNEYIGEAIEESSQLGNFLRKFHNSQIQLSHCSNCFIGNEIFKLMCPNIENRKYC